MIHTDVFDLRRFLRKDTPGNRVKFATKIFYVLNFTKAHPDTINIAGASWCADGVHFICNANIISEFLCLRPNSVNTNFRDHAFKIDHISLAQLAGEFPQITQIKNWKKRTNTKYSFTSSSSLSDVERIPCGTPRNENEADQIPEPRIVPKMDLAPSAFNLTKSDNFVFWKTLRLYNEMRGSTAFKTSLVDKVVSEWTEVTGGKISIHVTKFVRDLLAPYQGQPDLPQIEANFVFLLQQPIDSCSDGLISLDHYLRFVLRYGFIEDSVRIVGQLTGDPDTQGFNGIHPNFQRWFYPSLGEDTAISLMNAQNGPVWLVRPSNGAGQFSLMMKQVHEQNYAFLMGFIESDPMSEEYRFSMHYSENKIVSAADWHKLLFHELRLNVGESLNVPNDHRTVTLVSANELLQKHKIFIPPISQIPMSQPITSLIPLPPTRRPVNFSQ